MFATCPKGLESLLLTELEALGATDLKETVAGVHFEAQLSIAYRICLWSRLANRVLLPLAEFEIPDDASLYAGVKAIAWEEHLAPEATFAVDFSGTTPAIRNTHYGSLKVKDAIVDYFREQRGQRPSVDTRRPQMRINVRAHRARARVSIDLAGESLHRRGYRLAGGAAPLKENLASALLLRAEWPRIAAAGGALLDPLCGSGTLLIEGATMAMGIAPGLGRRDWGFDHWQGHVPRLWRDTLEPARAARDEAVGKRWPDILGYDADPKAVVQAERNIAAAGLEAHIRVRRKELARLVRPTHRQLTAGLILTNPPYGERIGEEPGLVHLYRLLGTKLREEFCGWHAAVMTGNPDLGRTMGLRASRQYRLFNGRIASKLLLFEIRPEQFVGSSGGAPTDAGAPSLGLGPGADMLANRLRKNLRHRHRWARRRDIACYRVYDADLPEYAVAIDRYGDWVHVAEYQAPRSVDPAAARRRLQEVILAIPAVLGTPAERIVVKQRRRQRGTEQYRKNAEVGRLLEVREGRARLLVNLHDYLDTGLFLDHRAVRLKIAELASGKRFLNLFCYTGGATVHAGLGGARSSVSVDLSPTYLRWARRNFALNDLDEDRHRPVRADCLAWLRETGERFDLILLDPPTFSNSKRAAGVLDLQRDHRTLIGAAMAHLSPDGLLIFSTNRRQFRLDPDLAATAFIEDVTDWSLDEDFDRARPCHRCWFLRHRTTRARGPYPG